MAIPPHRVRLPDPSSYQLEMSHKDQQFLRELVAALQREIDLRVRLDTARQELLLFSPNGSVYAVVVDDLGGLDVELRSQGA